ncbi:MAG: SH3 domain-containing protein [Clostridia bacterium]|nr:SH3 domain-containing protein [Clostridia bacterium]
MYTSVASSMLNFPQWYLVEKETEKIIKKLTTIKELLFYIKNQDESIRRLAILRIYELKLKESVDILSEIMEDRLETSENRDLAALTLKSISLKWDIDLFISSKLLSKYKGNEKYCDLFKVSISEAIPSIKFDFSSSLNDFEQHFESTNARPNEDIRFDMPFSLKEWLAAWFYEFKASARILLINFPRIFATQIKKLFQFIYLHMVKGLFIKTSTLFKGFFESLKHKRTAKSSYESYYEASRPKLHPLKFFKTSASNLLYAIFYPVRLLLKHKVFSFGVLMVLYILLTYTTYGRIITYRYTGLDIRETQVKAFYSSKEIMTYALDELKDIFGISNSKDQRVSSMSDSSTNQSAPTDMSSKPLYLVTAKTGLNLRKDPSPSSAKVTEQMLAFNSTVTFLSKSQKDLEGRVWYYVQTADGKTGWVYSKWLKKKGDD